MMKVYRSWQEWKNLSKFWRKNKLLDWRKRVNFHTLSRRLLLFPVAEIYIKSWPLSSSLLLPKHLPCLPFTTDHCTCRCWPQCFLLQECPLFFQNKSHLSFLSLVCMGCMIYFLSLAEHHRQLNVVARLCGNHAGGLLGWSKRRFLVSRLLILFSSVIL